MKYTRGRRCQEWNGFENVEMKYLLADEAQRETDRQTETEVLCEKKKTHTKKRQRSRQSAMSTFCTWKQKISSFASKFSSHV